VASPPGLVLIFLPFLPSFQEKPFGGKASPWLPTVEFASALDLG
jgi:hypothetical protein